MLIDVHTHFIPPEVLEWLRANREPMQAVWETRRADQEPFLTVGGQWPFELKTAFYRSEEYLRRQTAAGVTYTLVSPVPQLFAYEAQGRWPMNWRGYIIRRWPVG